MSKDKKPILLWLNAVLFYDINNLIPKNKKEHMLDWLNDREPLRTRIKKYNQEHS